MHSSTRKPVVRAAPNREDVMFTKLHVFEQTRYCRTAFFRVEHAGRQEHRRHLRR